MPRRFKPLARMYDLHMGGVGRLDGCTREWWNRKLNRGGVKFKLLYVHRRYRHSAVKMVKTEQLKLLAFAPEV